MPVSEARLQAIADKAGHTACQILADNPTMTHLLIGFATEDYTVAVESTKA